jgi:hypothetical protein
MISKIISILVGLTLLAAFEPMSQAQVSAAPTTAAESTTYQAGWDVQVPANTRLEAIKTLYERRGVRLPVRNLADQSPLPGWIRADNPSDRIPTGRRSLPDLYFGSAGLFSLLAWSGAAAGGAPCA